MLFSPLITCASVISIFEAKDKKKDISEIKEILSEVVLEKVLEAVRDGKIDKGDVRGVLIKVVDGISVEDSLKVEKIDDNELEAEISKIVKSKVTIESQPAALVKT